MEVSVVSLILSIHFTIEWRSSVRFGSKTRQCVVDAQTFDRLLGHAMLAFSFCHPTPGWRHDVIKRVAIISGQRHCWTWRCNTTIVTTWTIAVTPTLDHHPGWSLIQPTSASRRMSRMRGLWLSMDGHLPIACPACIITCFTHKKSAILL